MKILLDTSFVLACIKKKIDFINQIDEIFSEKIEFIVPEEVLDELKTISTRLGEKMVDKSAAEIGVKLLNGMKTIRLGNRNTDDGIVDYLKTEDCILATIDNGLQKRVKRGILAIKNNKTLDLVA